MGQEHEVVRGFSTDKGIAKYDYESLENIPSLIKTINGEGPDSQGNIALNFSDSVTIEQLNALAEQIDLLNQILENKSSIQMITWGVGD